jgi:predicted DNA-binding antitoxin AbrB/MazE fold protein
MQHLKHKKHEVLLFHVTDKKTELDFDFDERPYEFIDLESGEKVKIQPSQVKEKYIAVLEDFQHELKIKCGQYKIDYIEVDIEKGFDQILSSFLAKRAKMR